MMEILTIVWKEGGKYFDWRFLAWKGSLVIIYININRVILIWSR